MKTKKVYYKSPFHMVSPSPWPYLMSVSVFTSAMGFVLYVHKNVPYLLFLGLVSIVGVFSLWMSDMVSEATFQGAHTLSVITTLSYGFMLFILSEVMFFFSFFWAYMYAAISPSMQIGVTWPPLGIEPMNPWGLPLLNTVILVVSGCYVTVSHHSLVGGNLEQALKHLNLTYLAGIVFTAIQYVEFSNSPYTIACSVYGSAFFMLTGFHGLHVVVGTIFLVVQYYSMKYGHFTVNRHLGLECAMLYWHFVDVVWMLVFFLIYVWGGHGS